MGFSYASYSALYWVPTSICTAAIVPRIFVRAQLRNFGPEDVLMFVAYGCFVLAASLSQVAIFDEHMVQHYSLVRFNALSTASSVFIVVCVFSAKASVSFLLLRISTGSSARWRTWLVYVTLTILAILTVPMLFFQVVTACNEPKSTWTVNYCVPNSSIVTGFVESHDFYSAFFDILYSVLPSTLLWQIRISICRKAYISALLGLGWIAAIFTIMRALVGHIRGVPLDEAIMIENLSTVLEPSLIIVCGSLSALIPLFDFWVDGRPISPRGSSANPRRLLGKGFKKIEGNDQAPVKPHGVPQFPALELHRTVHVHVTTGIAA